MKGIEKKKKILIFGAGKSGEATASILSNIFNSDLMPYEFSYLCLGDNNIRINNTHYIKRFNKGLTGLILKALRKIRIIFKKDFYNVGFPIYYFEFKRTIKSEKFDFVFSTPGIYSLMAYKYAIVS